MNQISPRFSSWEDAVTWLRQQPDQLDLVHDAYYDDPLITVANRYWKSGEWEEVKAYLGSTTGAALDVGAGRGIASYALAKEGFAVTALEPDGSALVGTGAIRKLASESQLNIQVVQELSESLPFEDGYFDVVFARAVLHHTNDLQAACKEFQRVLKPGGQFIAIREHVISRDSDLQEFLRSHPLHKLYGGEHAYLLEEYIGALRSAGFHIQVTLKPFDSVINFSPYTEVSLKDELIDKLVIPNWLRKLPRSILDVPGIWSLARRVLSMVDHRPGRLYSFICERR